MKKIATLILAASVLGLGGCGMPAGLSSLSVAPEVVADAGNAGAKSAIIDLKEAFAAQATVHRWVLEDIVRYNVTLAEVSPGSEAVVAGDETFLALGFADAKAGGLSAALTSAASKVRFTGLKAGKMYAAFIVVEGRKKGSGDPLKILNKTQGYLVKNQLIDFTGGNDLEESQRITASIRLDDVPFSGTGEVAIDDVTDGTYSNPTGPVSGAPVN